MDPMYILIPLALVTVAFLYFLLDRYTCYLMDRYNTWLRERDSEDAARKTERNFEEVE